MTYNSTEILSTPHREIHELSVDEKKKIPSNVHSQLSKDFVSAARGIAHAGLDLVHNCQVLQKSFDHYMDILGSFVNSSKKAFSKAKEHSDELGALKTKCSQVLDKHKTCYYKFQIRELSGLVAKINEFTTDEKDKLKGMLNKFQKDEKRVKKQVKKGVKDNETEHGDVTDEAKSSSTDDNDSQQQETVTGMDAVSSTETRSPSFNDASTQINRDTLTPCTVASPVSQDSSVELSPLTSSKAKSTQAIPDKCEKAEWVNNATSLLPRLVTTHPLEDYHSDKFFMDPTEYRTVDHGTRLRNGRRPPVGGRMVLPPLQNNTPHCYVESMYDSKATASHLQVSQNTRDVIENEVAPLFSNSDYGRILTVNEDFYSTSGEQITVNRGNKKFKIFLWEEFIDRNGHLM
ncbi:hypothetical protein DICVIV_12971 [Dictyocaulus viviparus]|uniref:IMD domain-containing protein n=1 Tax=Dictyocaulus viviparus TaxID=29172 RepID=A0A0D8X8Z6_DICVI|nr:hypothetical protein DICVIV_12971 [Dictyocaulus viviparus]